MQKSVEDSNKKAYSSRNNGKAEGVDDKRPTNALRAKNHTYIKLAN